MLAFPRTPLDWIPCAVKGFLPVVVLTLLTSAAQAQSTTYNLQSGLQNQLTQVTYPDCSPTLTPSSPAFDATGQLTFTYKNICPLEQFQVNGTVTVKVPLLFTGTPGATSIVGVSSSQMISVTMSATYTGPTDVFGALSINLGGCTSVANPTTGKGSLTLTAPMQSCALPSTLTLGSSGGTTLSFTMTDSAMTVTAYAVYSQSSSCTTSTDRQGSSAQPGAPIPHAGPTCSAPSISITQELPSVTDPLIGLAADLPPFCASGLYTYNGPNFANIRLVLLDVNSNIVGSSPLTAPKGLNLAGQDLPPGTGQLWGYGCNPPPDANQLIYIPSAIMPNFNITPGMPYNQKVGNLKLQARLYDSVTNALLATSDATSTSVTYNVEPGVSATQVKVVLKNKDGSINYQVPLASPFAAPNNTTLNHFLPDNYNLPGTHPYLDVTLNSDVANATLHVKITAKTPQNTFIPIAWGDLRTPVTKGTNMDWYVPFDAELLNSIATIIIQPYITVAGYADDVSLDFPTVISFESITATATPDPLACDPNPAACLAPGSSATNFNPNTINVSGMVTAALPGESIYRYVTVSVNGKNIPPPDPGFRIDPGTPGQPNPFMDTVTVPVPGGTDQKVNIRYVLHHADQPASLSCECPEAPFNYTSFGTPVAAPATPGGAAPFLGGVFNSVKQAVVNAGKQIATNVTQNAVHGATGVSPAFQDDLKKYWQSLPTPGEKSVEKQPRAGASNSDVRHASTTSPNPPYLPIASSWSFNPPIPNNGSFSATISLDYSASQFPDVPNFSESKLQVISFDSSGTLHTYPTTLDTTNKIASAPVASLDPVYSLAVIGPFSQTPVMIATVPTSYALVNTGTQATDLSTTVFQTDGTAAPAASVLPTGNQLVATGPGWVQAWSNPSTVAGVSWLDNGTQFAVTPAVNPDQLFIFTDVEYNATTSTEIDLTNTSLFDSNITLNLFGADGTSQGSYGTLIPAKNSISGRVEGLFPSITAGFTGFLTVNSDQSLAASGIRWSGSTATGLVAQAANNTSFGTTSWYYPQLASGVTTTLHLVNTSTSPANVTLKAWSASGSAAAPTVKMQLASGQQYTGAVATIFGADPAGSIEVDSDTAGVFGDVLTVDGNFFPNFAVSLPLNGTPVTTSVLPYATSNTTVYVFNPSATAATVTVTPYNATGTAGAHTSMSVPANGSAAIGVSATAYATISSTQPVVAAGWMVVPSGTTTGYLSLPATFSPSTTGGTGPINGGGTTIEFGNVAVGSYATGTLTIYNTGTTSQTISSITASDPQFSVVTPARPFNVVAGSQQAITIQFAPTSAGEQSALLTITAGGSTALYAPVVLLGVGTPQPSGGSIEFGSVQVGSSSTGMVTVTNTGPASVNVTAIASS
ncbi:MAG TPA: DUF5719 family protein, partial [Bryobacteraceae bacterium]|nr:DUF5719 family protein [Bryobacteraceae bacterium]